MELVKIVVAILLLVMVIALQGVVISELWELFIVPEFEVQSMNALTGIGISLMSSVLFAGTGSKRSSEGVIAMLVIAAITIFSLWALGIGYAYLLGG